MNPKFKNYSLIDKRIIMMPNRILKLSLLLLFPIILSAQDSITQNISHAVEIPQELLDKIPRHHRSEFILGRQNAVKHNPEKQKQSIYEELNINSEVLSSIPNDQLLRFFNENGYIKIDTSHTDNSPTPEQAINILYAIIAAITLIGALCIILYHRRKLGEQNIVIKALENKTEIPLELLKKSNRKSYQQIAVILLVTGIGLLLFARFLNLPIELPLPLLFLGLGFFIASLFNRK